MSCEKLTQWEEKISFEEWISFSSTKNRKRVLTKSEILQIKHVLKYTRYNVTSAILHALLLPLTQIHVPSSPRKAYVHCQLALCADHEGGLPYLPSDSLPFPMTLSKIGKPHPEK